MKWCRRRSDARGPKGPNTQNQTPKKTKNIKRMISNMRRKAPPLPAVRRNGSGANRENPKTGKSRKLLVHPAIKGPQALITRSAKRTKHVPPKRNTLGVNNKEQRYKTKSAQKNGKRDTQGGWKVEMARPNWKTSNSEAIKKRQENQNLTSGNCRGMTYFLSQKQWVIHIFRVSIGRFRMKRHPGSSI